MTVPLRVEAFLIFRRASRWAVVVLLAAGCGQASVAGPDQSASTRAPRTPDNTAPAAAPSGVVEPAVLGSEGTTVLIGDHFIDPQTLVVKVGTTVTWRNSSGYHDVTSRDGLFSSPTLGDSYTHTFTEPGRYPYYCSFHGAEMRGEVVVEPAN